jgi:LacI family transcriptional regulator
MSSSVRPVTIRDVARLAQVSPASVSRHLNGTLKLQPQTVERIEAAIRELNFVPNSIARRLNSRRSDAIGLITSDIGYPLFASIASSAEEMADELGLSLVIFNSRNNIEKELRFLSKLDERQVDGIILLTNHTDDGRLRDKINSTRKVVLLDEDVPGAIAPRLFAENAEGSREAVAHLVASGHTRIAYVGGPRGLISVEERYAGYLEAHRAAGLSPDPSLTHFGQYVSPSGEAAFAELWNRPDRPSAFFAGGDMLAIGILQSARQAGLKVPQDFSIVSFDDMLHASMISPPLTTVRQSTEDFGRLGMQLMLSYLERGVLPQELPRLKTHLVVRESVGRPPRVLIR